jgi:hypothetical protein
LIALARLLWSCEEEEEEEATLRSENIQHPQQKFRQKLLTENNSTKAKTPIDLLSGFMHFSK